MNRFEPGDRINIEQSLHEDGYAIIEGAVDELSLQKLNQELEPWFRDGHSGHDDFMGHRTVRFGALLEKSVEVRKLILHPDVLAMADRLLLPHCANYHLHYTGVMRLMPGEAAQDLHRDTGIFPFANPCPPLTLATMWALDDFTPENGGTCLVPGSHLWDDMRNPKKSELLQTRMAAGSVLVYDSSVIHGGGHNASNTVRTGLAIHYGLGWLRQEENQYLACSAETARELPEALQALLGYQLAAPSFGFADHVHPRDYLHGIRDAAKSHVSSTDLRTTSANLMRLRVSSVPPERERFYEPD